MARFALAVAGLVAAVLVVALYELVFLPARQTIDLFPQAAEVRLFGGVDFIRQNGDGKVVGYRFEGRTVHKDVPATDGGLLSNDEIAALRKSFRFQAKWPVVAMCCTPRHAFVFYDGRHRQVGYLDVCFECGCVYMAPQPPHDSSLPYVDWDRAALERIVTAHHLPPLPKRE